MRTCAANWLHHQGSCTSCVHTCSSPSSPTTPWARSIKCISPKLRPTLLANIVHNDAVEEGGLVGALSTASAHTDATTALPEHRPLHFIQLHCPLLLPSSLPSSSDSTNGFMFCAAH